MPGFILIIVGFLFYLVAVGIYRLYLHPLAKIPGPTLAAATGWYESYFELFHRGLGGQYTFHIKELHQRYGPIVRINPWEVHIDDPNFFSVIYTNREGFDKPDYLKWRFGSPSALFSTPEHHIHKMRRSVQDPFFAKARIMRFSPVIQAKADEMCSRLIQDFVNLERPVNLDNLFSSFIADVATQYAFDRNFNWLQNADFKSPFLQAIQSFKNIAHPCTQFPWLARVLLALPESLLRLLQPSMSAVFDFQNEMRQLVRNAQRDLHDERFTDEKTSGFDKTIFHGILRSNLPDEELDVEMLKDHAVSLIAAGISSTQWTLRTAFFHIVNDKNIYTRLKQELQGAIPDPWEPVSLNDISEKLPYLTACIDEALRLACGQMTRSPRVGGTPITYDQYILPPGTHVSSDTWHMHHNESLYPDSFSFIPERWLGSPRAPDSYGSWPLKRYMVSFGSGTRNCLGTNLAMAEITIALVTIFTRFDWDLYETTQEDVRIVRDLIAPDVSTASQGIRAMVWNSVKTSAC